MLSLNQLLSTHPSLLVIDSASGRIQIGFFQADGFVTWSVSDDEAGVGIFRCVEELQLPLEKVHGFVFCDGPGSVLGIRTAASALRTWTTLKPRPMFSYSSLGLVAAALGRADITVIADARREMWHALKLGQPLRRVATDQLSGELITPAGFRQWSKPPANLSSAEYQIDRLLEQTKSLPLFQPTQSPDAFLHEAPSYLTWTPQIHRAPRN